MSLTASSREKLDTVVAAEARHLRPINGDHAHMTRTALSRAAYQGFGLSPASLGRMESALGMPNLDGQRFNFDNNSPAHPHYSDEDALLFGYHKLPIPLVNATRLAVVSMVPDHMSTYLPHSASALAMHLGWYSNADELTIHNLWECFGRNLQTETESPNELTADQVAQLSPSARQVIASCVEISFLTTIEYRQQFQTEQETRI